MNSLSKIDIDSREKKHLRRLRRHVLSQLVCLGRHTITNLLTTWGRQSVDWTADYRMYSRERIDCEKIFDQISAEVQVHNTEKKLLVTALDDSLLRKTGKKIPGLKCSLSL